MLVGERAVGVGEVRYIGYHPSTLSKDHLCLSSFFSKKITSFVKNASNDINSGVAPESRSILVPSKTELKATLASSLKLSENHSMQNRSLTKFLDERLLLL